jgi:predicted DsbA family dithiol-disulfide isomerase
VIADMVMATDFNGLANRYGVSAVPHTVVNETVSFVGALPEHEFLVQVLKAAGH